MPSWQDILVFGIMLASAVVPFVVICKLMLAGKSGLALSILSVIGACLAIGLFASVRPFGIDPLQAIVASMIVLIPATAGGTAGILLGWLIYRRRNPPQ